MSLTAPNAAVLGTTGLVVVNWAGVLPDQKYLGVVAHNCPLGLLILTLVNVDTMP